MHRFNNKLENVFNNIKHYIHKKEKEIEEKKERKEK